MPKNKNTNKLSKNLELEKIAHHLTAIKQLSHRYSFAGSEIEKTFYAQQIKNIFLQVLQPMLQQQNFSEQNSIYSCEYTKQIAKLILDTNFALKVIIKETVKNHSGDGYSENENLIIGQLEDCIQSTDFVDIDNQQCQLITISIPILSWSSYNLPSGNISISQCKKIAEIFRNTIASKENKAVIFANYLFDKNEIPDSYLSSVQLTQTMLNSYLIMRKNNAEKSKKISKENNIFIAEICRSEEIEIVEDNTENNSDYDENYDYDNIAYIEVDGDDCDDINNRDLSEVKFLLGAIIIPKNKPAFSWMNINEKTNLLFSLDDVYKKWNKKITPVINNIFKGCDFQTILPETLFNTLQPAIVISRSYGLSALLKYLRSIIGIIPTQLRVLIAGFYSFENTKNNDDKTDSNDSNNDNTDDENNELLQEFRLSFKVRGSNQILCGYAWELLYNSFSDDDYNNDIKEEENLSEIIEILKANNILDIRVIDTHFEYCLCQNCQQRLYINDDNELVHAKLPEYLVFNKPN